MMTRIKYTLVVLLSVLFLLASCAPTTTVPVTSGSFPTETREPTPPVDLTIARQAAGLYQQDFEGVSSPGIIESFGTWSISEDDPGHHVYCNGLSGDWQSFKFGWQSWSDYAIEMDVKLLNPETGPGVEVYARVDSYASGYRGSLYYSQATLDYYPPSQTLGGASITTTSDHWYTFRLEAAGSHLRFFIDDQLVADVTDSQRLTGMAGFGTAPNSLACVDNIHAWALLPDGQVAQSAPVDQVVNADPNAIYEGNCVFCFIDGSDPSMPAWSDSVQGYIPQESDTREQIVLDENFIVPAGQTATYDNKIILIQPHRRHDIRIYGTLVIKNSLLLWQQTEHQQTRLRIEDGGILDIENSYSFQGNQFWVNWDFQDGSTVSFDHFVGDPWTSLNGSVEYSARNYSTVKLTIFSNVHDTHIQILDAHHVWFEFYPAVGTHVITFPEKRHWSDWTITDLWPNTTVNVSHSYIYERDMSLTNDVHITVTDTPSGFSLGWSLQKNTPGFVDCELDGLGDPERDEGVFYENATWDLPCINSSLTVINSLLQRAWPVTSGYIHLKVTDSNLADPRNYGAPSTYEIYGSTIDHAAAYGGGLMYIEDSKIRNDVQINGVNSIIYVYGVTARVPGYIFSVMQESGGRYIELESPGAPWR